MFSYRPPKSSCWGPFIRPKDPLKAKQRVNAFFEIYFRRLDPEWDATRQLTLTLSWKVSILPNVEPPEKLQQQVLFIVTGDRVMFPGGLWIPISSAEPASYEFLRRFSADAPFKMSPKHFQVGIVGKTGRLAWRKPDEDIAAKLQQVIV
jgi:hypothetical protein